MQENIKQTIEKSSPAFGLNSKDFKEKVFQFVDSQKNKSRLLMIFGFAGVGKSYLMRQIVEKVGQAAIYVNSTDMLEISPECKRMKEVFNKSKSNKNSILIIDSIQSIAHTQSVGWKPQELFIEFLQSQANSSDSSLKTILITQTISKLDRRIQDIVKRDQIIVLSLPSQSQRFQILRDKFSQGVYKQTLKDQELKVIADKTEGYSIGDVLVMIRDAQYMPLRKLISAKKFKKLQNGTYGVAGPQEDGLTLPIQEVAQNFDLTISYKDLLDSFQKSSPSIACEYKEYTNLSRWRI